MMLLSNLLRRFVRRGRLVVLDHTGQAHRFGTGEDGPEVTIRLTDKAVEREIFLNPELKTAEAYMDGRLVMEGGAPVFDLLYLFSINRSGLAVGQERSTGGRSWAVTWYQGRVAYLDDLLDAGAGCGFTDSDSVNDSNSVAALHRCADGGSRCVRIDFELRSPKMP
jgi:hypothetical protein